jgi:NAD(P)-dependent dehydrogenase (short-subunit alcohol dehydrogenase family)
MTGWSLATMDSQNGKIAVITGANSGIGYDAALQLAKAGALVILACRSESKGIAAAAKIQAAAPGALVKFEKLDLASLASVRDFAQRFKADHATLDLLVNNAGLMALKTRQVTADGFEMQLGVNFLGHFALTALLLPALMKANAPRVVQLSSIAHKSGRINLTDLQAERGYKAWVVYQQSKLAMLMFALELQRRSDAGGWGILSVAAHPGIATTELMANGPGTGGAMGLAMNLFGPIFMHSSAAGALPTLLAATSPEVKPGGYYGPQNFMEMKGPPGAAKIAPQAKDETIAAALWDAAEVLTGEKLTPGP